VAGTKTQNFDVIYEISLDRLLNVLSNPIINILPAVLGNVGIVVPFSGPLAGTTQSGIVSLPARPTPHLSIDSSNANGLLLVLQFTQAFSQLDPVAGVVAGLPATAAGSTTLTLHLGINTQTVGTSSPVSISIAGVSSLSRLSGLSSLSIPTPSGVTLTDRQNQVQAGVETAVRSKVESLFPLQFPISLPVDGPCGIFPRELRLKLLSGAGGNSLAFLLALRGTTVGQGNSDGVMSSLEPGDDAALTIANRLIVQLICCLLPLSDQIQPQLPATPTEITDECCRWRNLGTRSLAGTQFSVFLLEICVADGLLFHGQLGQSGTGWIATIEFHVPINIGLQSGSVVPVIGIPDINVDVDLEWWVWLLEVVAIVVGTVIGFLLGGPVAGFGIGALVGAIVVGLLYLVFQGLGTLVSSVVGQTLGVIVQTLQKLNILPVDLTNTFGSLELLRGVILDDLAVRGYVVLPDETPPIAASPDQLLLEGQSLDLDTGSVLPPLTSGIVNPEADLLRVMPTSTGAVAFFSPGISGAVNTGFIGGLESESSARLVTLGEASFAALTEGDLRSLTYPAGRTSIPLGSIPFASDPQPANALVFGVRTTEGRFSKCAGWRDAGARIHVRYHTYDTPLQLLLHEEWNATRLSGAGGTFLLTWHGTLIAEWKSQLPGTVIAFAPGLGRVSFRWFWEGNEITGNGILPDGTTRYAVANQRCEIWTMAGKSLKGQICVMGQELGSLSVTACRDVDLKGGGNIFTNGGNGSGAGSGGRLPP
jgi:hypothetical protein